MGRLETRSLGRLSLALAIGLLTACTTTEKEPEKTWEELRAERVSDFLLHLNNASKSERWRDGLIEVGQRTPEDRTFVLAELLEAYEESMSRGGIGTGVLRTPGRKRVMEVTAGLGKTPAGSKLLQRGLEDDDPVALAAASGLVGWGDKKTISILVTLVLRTSDADPDLQKGLQALRRAASPKSRDAFLGALSSGDQRLIRPVVLATFPDDQVPRWKALRKVVRSHRNPYAKRFAMEILMNEKDPQVVVLAKAALAKGDRVVRPMALKALGAIGGDSAAREIESFLRTDPSDARAVVRGLFEVGSQEALERAVNMLGDDGLKSKTRAAIATEFMGRMKDENAPGLYQKNDSLEEALSGLRGVLEEGKDRLTIAAIRAIGTIGDRDTEVDTLNGVLADPTPKVANAVVAALGRLGGEHAALKLIELLTDDPDLRMKAAKALGSFASAQDVPVAELIDLLDDEDEDRRQAAHLALMGLRKSTDPLGYNYAEDEDARAGGLERWRGWWNSRRGG